MPRPEPHAVRRVVVTGLGVTCALGCELEAVWQAVLGGRSGIGHIDQFDSTSLPVRIGAEVDLRLLDDEPDPWIRCNRTLRFGLAALRQAWSAARLTGATIDRTRAGVIVGGGVFPAVEEIVAGTGLELFAGSGVSNRHYLELYEQRPELLSQQDLSAVSYVLSEALGLRGPSWTVQAACASSTMAIGEALRCIRRGDCDLLVTGGSDSMMSMFSVAGFTLLGALSRHQQPEAASRPFDRTRDGFVLGEGAGIAVLEELAHAQARGAPILAEVVGYGASADAYRFTDMDPQVVGAAKAMTAALADASVAPEEIGYVNAHGTSTPQNDRLETRALEAAFGAAAPQLAISSTKSHIGHLLCAAGGIEFVFTALALRDQHLPPTLNLHHPDPECGLDYLPLHSRRAEVDLAMSNSFGFGGQNGSLVLRRWQETS